MCNSTSFKSVGTAVTTQNFTCLLFLIFAKIYRQTRRHIPEDFNRPRCFMSFLLHRTLLTYLLTYLPTAWCRVLLEKLTGSQPVKKFPAFYATRRFVTAFTSARHLSLSRASSIQSILPHPTPWTSILILPSHLQLCLPSGLLSSGFPTKTLYTSLLAPHMRYMPRPSHSFRFYHPNNIWWAVQIIKLLIT